MVYKNNIPQPGDSPATVSQADLLENFAQLDSQYGTAGDHVEFTAGSDNGMHKQVTINGVVADPNLPDPQASLYLKTVAGDSQLFFENFDVGAAANLVRQMTNLTITTAGSNNGFVTPWGVTMNWGQVTTTANTPVTVTFAVAFTSAVGTIQLTPIFNSGADRTAVVSTGSVALNQFQVRSSNNGMVAYYFAMGV